MKKIKFFSLIGFLILSYCATAQIKVYDDNRVKIFGDKPTDDLYKDLSMQIFGTYGSYLANGRLAFGEYELNGNALYTPRVFAGELGINIDSDKLELCGSSGLYFTWGQGYSYNNIIGKLDQSFTIVNDVIVDNSTFHFYTDVYSKGIILNSDLRFKENISPLQGSLSKLKLIRGVSYNLKRETSSSNTFPEYGSPCSEKEKNDLALLAATKEKLEGMKRERLGFIAQELQEVYPGLVEENSDGYLYVDYIGLIPVLVESIKEQQIQIATLETFLKSQDLK